jgi:hypothetical protein
MYDLLPPTCDDTLLWDIAFAHLQEVVVSLADELGLFAALAWVAGDRAEIARRLGLHPLSCEALLGALTGLGLLAQHEGRFALTPAARNFLLPDSPYYRGILLRKIRVFPRYQSVREGLLRDRERERGTQAWETGEMDPEDAREITARMHVQALPSAVGARYPEKSFAALPPGGRIYVHEALLADTRDAPLTTALFSLAMVLESQGKQFAAGELRELLEAGGFESVSVTPTYGYYSLTMGRKAVLGEASR